MEEWKITQCQKTLARKLEIILLGVQSKTPGISIAYTLISKPLENWLKKLLVFSFELDDFLEELALWNIQSPEKTKNEIGALQRCTSFDTRLDQIYDDFSKFEFSSTEATTINENSDNLIFRESDPLTDQGPIVGRDDDVRKTMDMILQASRINTSRINSYVPVICIEGIAGIGKTVLAQLIYKNETVSEHFSERFWVSANDKNFGVNMVVMKMYGLLTGRKWEEGLTIEAREEKIQEMLKGKRYLLILDDVLDDAACKSIRDLLRETGTSMGSIILITRSRKLLLSTMPPFFSYNLDQLTEDHSWNLFHVVTCSKIGLKITSELEANCRMLVKQMGGLPFLIKTVADQLSSRLSLDQSDLLDLYEQIKEYVIFPSLRPSFDSLPSAYIKLCFSFCATLPKGSRIYKDELVQKWMAQGYLIPGLHRPNLNIEERGEAYLESILQNSLLQNVEKDHYGKIVSCSMHDLVHDLAIYISNRCNLNSDTSKTANRYGVRDLSFFPNEGQNLSPFPRAWECPKPSTGSSSMLRDKELHSNALVNQIEFFTCLRSLSLVETNMEELPSSVSSLKHLRYLDISRTPIKRVPTSVTLLYKLETFRILQCWFLKQFPENFDKLVNLRHFYMDDDKNHRDLLPRGLGQLSSLQTLPFFVVDPKRGRKIEELGKLPKLKGELKIYNLEHVKGKDEARKAKLDCKSKIHSLKFHWSSDGAIIDINNDESVLEGLKPHGNLERLKIENYEGLRLPSWMTRTTASSAFQNVVELRLKNCRTITEVCIVGHTPLKVLSMEGMHSLEIIASPSNVRTKGVTKPAFWGLKELTLRDMPKLHRWLSPDYHPLLEKLVIESCPLLMSVPSSSFPAMNELVVEDIDYIVLREISRWLTTLKSLVIGMVSGSSDLFFCLENFLGSNSQLKQLRVQRCENLYKFPEELWNHPTLKSLEIWDCPNLHHIPRIQEPHSLLVFSICGCHNLSTLPMGLNNLKHLETFSISGCHQLYWVDSVDIRVLASLQKLIISDCGFLTSSDDWPQWLLSLTGLKDLTIGGFPRYLDYFPFPTSFDSLKNLTLEGWPSLKSLPTELQNFTALVELRIFGFEGMEVLPEWLSNLSSLEYMQLWHCAILEYFPSNEAMKCLTKLLSLDIGGCPLLEERCIKGIGSEWDKISHIPSIRIGNDYITGRRR